MKSKSGKEMLSTDSIFIRRHPAISLICTILIIYPNMMWMLWNVAGLSPGELVAFWATAIFWCLFFFFIRANKQFIITRDAIKDLVVWVDNRLKVVLHTEIPEPIYISKNRVAEFKEWSTS